MNKMITKFNIYESIRDKMTGKDINVIEKNIYDRMNRYPELGTFDWKKWGWTIDYEDIYGSTIDSYFFIDPNNKKYLISLTEDDIELRAYPYKVGKIFNNYEDLDDYLDFRYNERTTYYDKFKKNESIRDLMTPKSEEDVWDALVNMSLLDIMKWMINNAGEADMFEKEDLIDQFEDCTLREKRDIVAYAIKSNILSRPTDIRQVPDRELSSVFKEILRYFFYIGESLQDSLTGKPVEHITNVHHFRRYNFIEDWADDKKYRNHVGYIVIDDEYKNELYLSSFTIWEPYKGKGLGRKYLNIVLDELKKFDQYPWIGLSVMKDNEIAIKLYRSVGFRNESEVDEYNGAGKNYKNDIYYFMVKENK